MGMPEVELAALNSIRWCEAMFAAHGLASQTDGRIDETWAALVRALSAGFPGMPIVGYERGADLSLAKAAGFVAIGPLRLWCRPG